MGIISDRKSKWTLKSVLDLESQRMLDRSLDERELEARDRRIYRALQPHASGSDRSLLFKWLQAISNIRPLEPNTGDVFSVSYGMFTLLASFFAFFSGLSATYVALRYDGNVPVNVSIFLGILILPQILLMLGYVPLMLWVFFRPSFMTTAYAIPSKWGQQILSTLWVQIVKKKHAESRQS